MSGKQRYPDEPRFKGPTTIAMIETRIEVGGEIKTERCCYISSRVLTAKAFAGAAPGKTSIKGKRKLATWDTSYLLSALSLNLR